MLNMYWLRWWLNILCVHIKQYEIHIWIAMFNLNLMEKCFYHHVLININVKFMDARSFHVQFHLHEQTIDVIAGYEWIWWHRSYVWTFSSGSYAEFEVLEWSMCCGKGILIICIDDSIVILWCSCNPTVSLLHVFMVTITVSFLI